VQWPRSRHPPVCALLSMPQMLELKVIEIDQVQPFIKQFRLLDCDGNARLGRADLEASCNQSLAELQLASQVRMQSHAKMSVGDRQGVKLVREAPGAQPTEP